MDAGIRAYHDPFRLVHGGEPSELQRNALVLAYREACRGELGMELLMLLSPDEVEPNAISIQLAKKHRTVDDYFEEADRLGDSLQQRKERRP